MAEPERLHFVLSRLPNAELVVVSGVEQLGAALGFARDTLDEVKLAVLEACLNALEHGGSEVEVELVAHQGREPWMEVSVVDRGPGFDPGTVASPRLNDKLHAQRKRGWGLELMRRLMDHVEILSVPGRTQVRMVRGRRGV